MIIFNYNDANWSRKLNCVALKDCSGRTITDNGSKALASITNHRLTRQQYADLYHLGIDITGLLGMATLLNRKFLKHSLTGATLLMLLYLKGRYSYRKLDSQVPSKR